MYIAPGELLIFCGPTASGKSALALEWAEKLGGEIVSVDSMQLYRGLAIGTAQPSAEEQKRVRHHFIGTFDIHERIDVSRYAALAEKVIADILARGRIPVLAGGTGLYLRTLLYGMDDLPADRTLRAELDDRYDRDDAEEQLFAELEKRDPVTLQKFRTCRRRLIRALEVAILTGEPLSKLQSMPRRCRYPVRAYRIEREAEDLKNRIRKRTETMLRSGWIEEAQQAIRNGLLETPTAYQALGYRQIAGFLAGKCNYDELTERIATATWQYARRQRTWFKHQHPEAQSLIP